MLSNFNNAPEKINDFIEAILPDEFAITVILSFYNNIEKLVSFDNMMALFNAFVGHSEYIIDKCLKIALANSDYNTYQYMRDVINNAGNNDLQDFVNKKFGERFSVVPRTFEPPERVYKQCVDGVIVEATIPDDALVRGKPGEKCRASKAIITKIYSKEPYAISYYDPLNSVYRVGDLIEIDNFDKSYEECGKGFHFFCTKEEAEQYLMY